MKGDRWPASLRPWTQLFVPFLATLQPHTARVLGREGTLGRGVRSIPGLVVSALSTYSRNDRRSLPQTLEGPPLSEP